MNKIYGGYEEKANKKWEQQREALFLRQFTANTSEFKFTTFGGIWCLFYIPLHIWRRRQNSKGEKEGRRTPVAYDDDVQAHSLVP